MQQTVGEKIVHRQKEFKAQKRHAALRRAGHRLVLVAFLATLALPVLILTNKEALAAHPYQASDVLGQLDGTGNPRFTTNDLYNNSALAPDGGINLAQLDTPSGIAVDETNHLLFVSDEFQNRVLVYQLDNSINLNSYTAFKVIGQDDLNTYETNNLLTQNRMDTPMAVAYDSNRDWLFVGDDSNCRVLVFNLSGGITNGMNASYVLGEPDFSTSNCSTTQDGLDGASGLAFDPVTENLFVGDYFNRRAIVYDTTSITNGMNASHVLGKSDFTTNTIQTTQSGTGGVSGVFYDTGSSQLFVADDTNNRTLVFDLSGGITDGMNASHVLGQPNFTSGGISITQAGQDGPIDIAYDAARQRLFVAEFDGSRTMVYDISGGITDGMNASYVLGQPNFTAQDFTRDQNGQDSPLSVEYIASSDTVLVGDFRRVLEYDASALATSMNAQALIGQNDGSNKPDYTTYFYDGYGWYGDAVAGSEATLIDTVDHHLFVADMENQRILVYNLDNSNNLTSAHADYVIGRQKFNAMALNASPSQSNLMWDFSSQPLQMAYDPVGNRLFVTDPDFYRVMVFDFGSGITDGMNASHVLGQPDFTSGGQSTTQNGMYMPTGIALDQANQRLFVSDGPNMRVLVYDISGGITNGMNASYVLGQTDFTSNAGPTGSGSEPNKLGNPAGLAYDSANERLFVEESSHVKIFNLSGGITNGMNASNIIGDNDFTYGGTSSMPYSQRFGGSPKAIWYDSSNQGLFVADSTFNRVLVFNLSGGITNGMAALDVVGQAGFSGSGFGLSQTALRNPTGITYDSANQRLYIADNNNNRVMIYDNFTIPPPPGTPYLASDVVGQMDGGGNAAFGQATAYNGAGTSSPNDEGFDYPQGSVIDPVGHRLFVSDCGYGVRVFNLDSTNTLVDRTADNILGQANFVATDTTVDQATMHCTGGASYDTANQLLFVPDIYNARVMIYDLSGGITDGMNAAHVLGQPNFTSNTTTTTQSGTSFIWGGTAYDPATQYLYLGDGSNARVLVYDLSGGISDGMNALYVLGQPNFTSSTSNLTQDGLGFPYGVAIDSANHRLFVNDWDSAGRVMIYDTSALSNGMNASNVLGEADFISSNSASDLGNFPDAKSFGPEGLAYDENHQRLFVEDGNSNRILIFDVNSITNNEDAVGVLGQYDFGYDVYDCTPTQAYMCGPNGITDYYDSANNRLYVSDSGNNRILVYGLADLEDSLTDGTEGSPYSVNVGAYTQGTCTYSVTAGSLPGGMSLNNTSGLISGTPASAGSYNFTIQVTDDNGTTGTFTDTVAYNFTVNSSGGGDTTAPTVPANVHEISSTTTTITVGWDASTDDTAVTGYHIYRDGGLIGSSATTNFLDSGLIPGTTYSYTVSAYDAASNESAQSSPGVDISTDNSSPSPPPPGPSPSPSPSPSPPPTPSGGGGGSSGGSSSSSGDDDTGGSGSQGSATNLDDGPGFSDGSGFTDTGDEGDSYSFTPAVPGDEPETITITKVASDTVTFEDGNGDSFDVNTGTEVSQDINRDNQPDIRLAVAQIDEGNASMTFWKVLPVKPGQPGGGSGSGSIASTGGFSGLSTWLDKILKLIFGHVPPVVVKFFPWLLFLLLLLTVTRLLLQARTESKATDKLQEDLALEKDLSEQKRNFITLGYHYLRTPLTAISGGIDLMRSLKVQGINSEALVRNSNELKSSVDSLIRDYIDPAAQPTPAEPALQSVQLLPTAQLLKNRYFIIPVFATVIVLGLADFLYGRVEDYNLATNMLLIHIAAAGLLLVLLLAALRLHELRKVAKANQANLLEQQHRLDSHRNQLILMAASSLETPLMAIRSELGKYQGDAKLIKPTLSGLGQFDSTVTSFRRIAGLAGAGIAARHQTLDLYALVNSATGKLKPELDAKKLRIELDLKQEWIESDDLLLGQVIESLLSNAVKYSPEGSVIKVGADKQDGHLQITVSDSGVGIAEDKLRQLFEPFSRAENAAEDFNRQGMGLSLYADRLIMQYLHGGIRLLRAEPQGTRAELTV
jgi:signal transduction histidine kinase/6-phosphogluconolactonase (cycloisomerase 2 family)